MAIRNARSLIHTVAALICLFGSATVILVSLFAFFFGDIGAAPMHETTTLSAFVFGTFAISLCATAFTVRFLLRHNPRTIILAVAFDFFLVLFGWLLAWISMERESANARWANGFI